MCLGNAVHVQWWCQYIPKVLADAQPPADGKCKRKRKLSSLAQQWTERTPVFEPNLNGLDAAHKAARFLRWFILDGKEGYKVPDKFVTSIRRHKPNMLLVITVASK